MAFGLGWALVSAAWAGQTPELLVRSGVPTLARGPVGVGQVLLTLPVRHARTGWLANRITMDSVFGRDPPLEIGQPLFAVPLAGGRMAWCAPRRWPDPRTWRTACLTPSFAGLYEWEIRRSPPLAPADLGQVNMGTSGQASAAPVVMPGLVPLPAMTLSLVLRDMASDGRSCELDLMVDWGDGPQLYDHRVVPMTPRGASARIMGMSLKLSPGGPPGEIKVHRAWF